MAQGNTTKNPHAGAHTRVAFRSDTGYSMDSSSAEKAQHVLTLPDGTSINTSIAPKAPGWTATAIATHKPNLATQFNSSAHLPLSNRSDPFARAQAHKKLREEQARKWAELEAQRPARRKNPVQQQQFKLEEELQRPGGRQQEQDLLPPTHLQHKRGEPGSINAAASNNTAQKLAAHPATRDTPFVSTPASTSASQLAEPPSYLSFLQDHLRLPPLQLPPPHQEQQNQQQEDTSSAAMPRSTTYEQEQKRYRNQRRNQRRKATQARRRKVMRKQQLREQEGGAQ